MLLQRLLVCLPSSGRVEGQSALLGLEDDPGALVGAASAGDRQYADARRRRRRGMHRPVLSADRGGQGERNDRSQPLEPVGVGPARSHSLDARAPSGFKAHLVRL